MFSSLPPDEVEALVVLLTRVAEALNAECAAVGASTTFHSQED